MSARWEKFLAPWLAAAILLTSCQSNVFFGSEPVDDPAATNQLSTLLSPPLTIDRTHPPLPGFGAKPYNPPAPPLAPFAIGRALAPELPALPGAILLDTPPLEPFPTPLPLADGPGFDWAASDNYLVLGTDHRPGWTQWRTDSVMVVGVDRTNSRVAVFSIPRDLYVQIPGYGWGRINQVDFMGERNGFGEGPKLVSQVLQATLGIATNHWVRVRMDGFQDVVNAVGGVTMRLDCPFYEPIFNLTTNQWDYFALPAGDVWMDGETAYWYVRLRLKESDIGRSQRQRQFLWALRDQVSNTNLIAKFPELWAAFQNTFTTDLNVLQMIDLLSFGISLSPGNVRASGLTLYDLQNYTTPEGAMVLRIADPNRVRGLVANVWSAPAMVDARRQDAATCPALPPGVDLTTASVPTDLSNVASPDEVTGAPPDPNTQPEAPVAPEPVTELPVVPPTATPAVELPLPTPTPAPAASGSIFPTPTPGPVSHNEQTGSGG